MKFPSRFAVPLALILSSVLFSAICLELVLRVIDYERPEAKAFCLDPVMRNVYCPNIGFTTTDPRDGRQGRATINSEGMADREFSREKSAGTLRMALLGSSVSASLYLPEELRFKAYWERDLSDFLGRPTEILNFAVDGQSTWEQLQMFRLRSRHFHPDYVVLVFTWGRDVWSNLASLEKGRPNPLKDEYQVSSTIVKFQVAHRNAIRWLWNNTLAFQFLDTLKEKIESKRRLDRAAGTAGAKPEEQRVQVSSELLKDPTFAWNSKAWELTRHLVAKLKAESEESGAPLIIVSISTLDHLLAPKLLQYAEFRAFLAEKQILNVDPFDALLRLSKQELMDLYASDHVHLSAEGQRIFAEMILPKLRELIASRDFRTR